MILQRHILRRFLKGSQNAKPTVSDDELEGTTMALEGHDSCLRELRVLVDVVFHLADRRSQALSNRL